MSSTNQGRCIGCGQCATGGPSEEARFESRLEAEIVDLAEGLPPGGTSGQSIGG